jgi:hypothetical protein
VGDLFLSVAEEDSGKGGSWRAHHHKLRTAISDALDHQYMQIQILYTRQHTFFSWHANFLHHFVFDYANFVYHMPDPALR